METECQYLTALNAQRSQYTLKASQPIAQCKRRRLRAESHSHTGIAVRPATSRDDEEGEYLTIIMIQGHAFHSGAMTRMLEMAPSLGYRFICPNRGLYPGSTPYTKDETGVFQPGRPTEEAVKGYLKQGECLLLFVDNMIGEYGLKRVLITGWSLGAGFLSAMVCSLKSVEEPLGVLTVLYTYSDPPSPVYGVPDPPTGGWAPLFDKTLTIEERQIAFGDWVVQYFPHPNIEEKNPRNLIYKNATQTKAKTYADLPPAKFLEMADFTAGDKGDSVFGEKEFARIGRVMWDLTFFNAETRRAWQDVQFGVIYGEESTWTVVWEVWRLEMEAMEKGMPVRCIGMPGVNHFGQGDRLTEV
ncbi:hypothetical protein D9613_012559 [Agrocybe pediades]|uniref:AB hydrolase-1 domain-containing protein n=1 Tax=Agrocybe pediades TaxID=84607 RepID=A0A8H4QRS1_9AGAR|nr:hypothetical protein D9613_012559 [Agrocybe pediades]